MLTRRALGGRLPFRRHIAGAGVSPRCAAVVLPCFKVRDVPYHIVVARLTSYGMCHWSTRVRRASHLEMRFRASCERPVATWSVISAWAARMPAASRECSHALEEAKSAHTQCHPPPDSKKTRKRSIKYSLRTSEPRRPGFSTPMSSKSPSAYLKASAKQCWYVCTPPHRHAGMDAEAQVAARPTYVHSGNPTISRRSSSQSFMRAHSRLVRSVRLGACRSKGLDSNAARKR